MFRRLSLSVLLIACAATYVIAVERATFILTDGERKSGAVVYHGDQHENLINGFLNLGTRQRHRADLSAQSGCDYRFVPLADSRRLPNWRSWAPSTCW